MTLDTLVNEDRNKKSIKRFIPPPIRKKLSQTRMLAGFVYKGCIFLPHTLRPKNYVSEDFKSILDIDIETLKKQGIDSLVIDWEDTLGSVNSTEFFDSKIKEKFYELKKHFSVSIYTNEFKLRNVLHDKLQCCVTGPYYKPGIDGFKAAVKANESTYKKTAVIGDSRFFDGVGANVLGMKYLHIEHLTPYNEISWIQKAFRYCDAKVYWNVYLKRK